MAQVNYRKSPGHLTLTRDSLILSNAPGATGTILLTVPTNRMISKLHSSSLSSLVLAHLLTHAALFASKPDSPKVALKIALTPASLTSITEESYNFQFTAGASAVSDRERFKKELGEVVARNRARGGEGEGDAQPSGSGPMQVDGEEEDVKPDLAALSARDKGKGKAVAPPPAPGSSRPSPTSISLTPTSSSQAQGATRPPPTDFHLRKLILQSSPALLSLHRALVISHQISESEFWAGRQDLLDAARAAESQLRGKSGGMVDPRPETDERGDVTVKITPQLIMEIFEEYPMVLRAYNENVPEPVSRSVLSAATSPSPQRSRPPPTRTTAAQRTRILDTLLPVQALQPESHSQPRRRQHSQGRRHL